MTEFLEALRKLIKRAGSGASLARQAGLSPALISTYLSKPGTKAKPSLRKVVNLALTSARLENVNLQDELKRWLKLTSYSKVPEQQLEKVVNEQKRSLQLAKRGPVGKIQNWEESEFAKKLAAELQGLVDKLGSLNAVAERTGIAASMLSSYRSRKSRPSQEKAVALANLDAELKKLNRPEALTKWLRLCCREVPDVSQLSGLAAQESPLMRHELRQEMEQVLAPLFRLELEDQFLFNDLAFARMSQHNAIRRLEKWQKANLQGSVIAIWDYSSETNLKAALDEAELAKHLRSLLVGPEGQRSTWNEEQFCDVRCWFLLNGPSIMEDVEKIKKIFNGLTAGWKELPNWRERFAVRIKKQDELTLADRWLFYGSRSRDVRGSAIVPVGGLKEELKRWSDKEEFKVFSSEEDQVLWSSAVIEMSQPHVAELMKAQGIVKDKGVFLAFDKSDEQNPWKKIFP